MKRFTLLTMFALLFAVPGIAQIDISPMKVIYVRQQENLPDYKRRFEVTYPIVSGTRSDAVKRRLENTLSYWRAFESSLDENLRDDYALDSLDYVVTYNKGSILVIELIWSGSGAQVSEDMKTYVIDTSSGRRISVRQAFRNLPGLVGKLVEKQNAAVEAEISSRKETEPDAVEDIEIYMEGKTITESMLDEFMVTDDGVTFRFDFGFPHVVQALQPDGDYFFSWKEITPFVKARGPLAGFRDH